MQQLLKQLLLITMGVIARGRRRDARLFAVLGPQYKRHILAGAEEFSKAKGLCMFWLIYLWKLKMNQRVGLHKILSKIVFELEASLEYLKGHIQGSSFNHER